MATSKKKSTGKKTATKKSAHKAVKKKGAKRAAATGKNKLGVKNSLVNNINARKKKGIARSKKKSTVAKKAYSKLKTGWGRKK